jgi:hypothetical protein
MNRTDDNLRAGDVARIEALERQLRDLAEAALGYLDTRTSLSCIVLRRFAERAVAEIPRRIVAVRCHMCAGWRPADRDDCPRCQGSERA